MPHSPAPWRAEGYRQTVVNDRDGNTLALYPAHDRTAETAQANARLIAAAPELLAITELLADSLEESHMDEVEQDHYGDGPEGCSYCAAIARARAAIAKARGEA